jgi:hypothetical protein
MVETIVFAMIFVVCIVYAGTECAKQAAKAVQVFPSSFTQRDEKDTSGAI